MTVDVYGGRHHGLTRPCALAHFDQRPPDLVASRANPGRRRPVGPARRAVQRLRRAWSPQSASPSKRRSTRSPGSPRVGRHPLGARPRGAHAVPRPPATHSFALAAEAPAEEPPRGPPTWRPPRPDRDAGLRGRVRRPRAVVGGRRRAPPPRPSSSSPSVTEAMAAVRDADERPATIPDVASRTRREACHAPRRTGRAQGGAGAGRGRLRRLPRARAGPRDYPLGGRRRRAAARAAAQGQGRGDLGAVVAAPRRYTSGYGAGVLAGLVPAPLRPRSRGDDPRRAATRGSSAWPGTCGRSSSTPRRRRWSRRPGWPRTLAAVRGRPSVGLAS